jgi:hypothetical protein
VCGDIPLPRGKVGCVQWLAHRWRSAALLLPAGALTVHALRYLLVFGGGTREELAHTGHGYLGLLAPVVALLAAAGIGLLIRRLSRAWRTGEDKARRTSGALTWLALSAALAALYVGQELLEGVLAAGHPGGLAGVFGDGGWMALPLAVAIGGLLALALRGANAAAALVARLARARRKPLPRPTDALLGRRSHQVAFGLDPLLGCVTRRGPPPVPIAT